MMYRKVGLPFAIGIIIVLGVYLAGWAHASAWTIAGVFMGFGIGAAIFYMVRRWLR